MDDGWFRGMNAPAPSGEAMATALLAAPRGVTNHAAEVAAAEVGVFVCEYVRFHVSKGGLRLVFDAVVEGLQDILLEISPARERLHDCVAVGVRKAGVVDSEHVHFDACRDEGNDRMHVLRDAGSRVKCDRRPHVVDVLLGDVMATQEVARCICSIHLKTVRIAAVSRYETNVVEHSAGVEQFGVELETATLTGERAKVIDAAGVIEQQRRFCVADELRDFIGEFTVWNAYA